MASRNLTPLAPAAAVEPSSYSILLVDDEPLVGRILERTMLPYGINVVFANNASEAMALAERNAFPVVITDLQMPDVDGHAFIDRFRRRHPDSVFLVLTGAPNPDMGNDEASILRVLTKPWDEDELVETIRSAMRVATDMQAKASKSGHPCSVLLVEDDAADAALAKQILKSSGGFEVHLQSSVTGAVEYLRRRSVDVILTDLSLPDARGFDSIVRLQRVSPSTPLLALSGLGDESVALNAIRLGAQDFFTKGDQARHGLPRGIRLAVERKRVELRLREHANYDALTSLANRAHFEDMVSKALARAARRGSSSVIGMIDLDGFKAVNDTYGHEAGDEVLIRIASRLGSAVREYDMVARIGGDEFVFLLDDLQAPSDAMPIVERMLKEVGMPIRIAPGVEVNPGASIGVCAFPMAGRTLSDLRRVADGALYEAKGSGKNQIRFDPTSFDVQLGLVPEDEPEWAQPGRRDAVLRPARPEADRTRQDLPLLEPGPFLAQNRD